MPAVAPEIIWSLSKRRRSVMRSHRVWGSFRPSSQIRPTHNPLGPFDFMGCYDDRSDRRQTLAELVDRGYEDGFRQFVDPVVGASGEWIEPGQPRG